MSMIALMNVMSVALITMISTCDLDRNIRIRLKKKKNLNPNLTFSLIREVSFVIEKLFFNPERFIKIR
jgi:hypothetical protein